MVAWIYMDRIITLPVAGIISGCLMGITINAPVGQLYVTEALLRSGSVRLFEMSHFSLQNFARTHNTPNNSGNYTFLV